MTRTEAKTEAKLVRVRPDVHDRLKTYCETYDHGIGRTTERALLLGLEVLERQERAAASAR